MPLHWITIGHSIVSHGAPYLSRTCMQLAARPDDTIVFHSRLSHVCSRAVSITFFHAYDIILSRHRWAFLNSTIATTIMDQTLFCSLLSLVPLPVPSFSTFCTFQCPYTRQNCNIYAFKSFSNCLTSRTMT